MDERVERAAVLCDRAVYGGDPGAATLADAQLDAAEADVCLARGRVMHARFLADGVADPHQFDVLERARQLYRAVGDRHGEAEACGWVGAYHQVVARDGTAARPVLARAVELARAEGDALALAHALRHLGLAEAGAGRRDEAGALLRESLRLCRELGFHAGAAADLIELARLAALDHRPDRVARYLDEARALAEASSAYGVLRWVDDARRRLRADAED